MKVFNLVEFRKIDSPTAPTPTWSSRIELTLLGLALATWTNQRGESHGRVFDRSLLSLRLCAVRSRTSPMNWRLEGNSSRCRQEIDLWQRGKSAVYSLLSFHSPMLLMEFFDFDFEIRVLKRNEAKVSEIPREMDIAIVITEFTCGAKMENAHSS